MRQTLTDDFWGLHKNTNCAFPLNLHLQTIINSSIFCVKANLGSKANDFNVLSKKQHIIIEKLTYQPGYVFTVSKRNRIKLLRIQHTSKQLYVHSQQKKITQNH